MRVPRKQSHNGPITITIIVIIGHNKSAADLVSERVSVLGHLLFVARWVGVLSKIERYSSKKEEKRRLKRGRQLPGAFT